jgi:cysteinyl-tRNA synthetase
MDRAIPDEVRRMVAERESARRAKDYASADAIRGRIREAGFDVTDTPDRTEIAAIRTEVHRSKPSEVVNLLDQPSSFEATVQWIAEGWPEDVVRGIASFDLHHPNATLQHVVVDLTGADTSVWPHHVDLVSLKAGVGWAAGRNAGLARSLGRTVLIVDGSVEATGDVLTPIEGTLRGGDVGLTGPFGIVTDDLREFRESPGPDVDAIEAYLMALPRDLLREGLRFDEGFRFYRTADIELSFRVKDRGLRTVVTPVPVTRHEHRMWASTPQDRRAALSKRNYYRFLDAWRGRFDLTVAGVPPSTEGDRT